MNDNLEIRRAALKDASVALDLLAKQLEEHHVDLPTQELLLAISSVLEDERLGFILLAWVAERAIGVAYVSITWTLEHSGKTAWLEELYVLSDFRGRGIGAGLLNYVLAACRQLGCKAVDLEVEQDHSRAENLYRRHGFEPLPRQRWVKRFYS